MYKVIFLSVITFCFSSFLVAQSLDNISAGSKNENINSQRINEDDIENPDEAGTPMPNVGISEEKVIVEVVEGVGHVPYNRVAFRTEPSLKGNVIRYSSGAEKVLLIGETEDWYKVIMYNNQEAFIQKRYVRTAKFFIDETFTKNQMAKTLSIELDDLLAKFDKVIADSNYLKKYQTRPILRLTDARNVKNNVTLVFQYSCTDVYGKPIPSYKENELYKYMQQLIELILGRLILTNAESFNIVINTPVFNNEGGVVSFNKDYAVIKLNPEKVNKEELRKDNVSILNYVECSMSVQDLFKTYPK